jgi:hypothetical protein
MKQILYLIVITMLLAACRTSKDYLSRRDGDKALFDAVKKLNKTFNDAAASRALPVLYTAAQQRYLNRVKQYSANRDISRWDNAIAAYTTLQRMYDAITASDAASRLVMPVNYQNELYSSMQAAAEECYQQGTAWLNTGNRENAKKAYHIFKRSGRYVNSYKDSRRKMEEAYQSSIINVVINPLADNSFFFSSGWGSTGYNYSNEYFQQTLVRELGGIHANRYPARFYTEWEARSANITPDWVVSLTLRNIDIPRPAINQHSRNQSRQIEKGRDSTGAIMYETVYATVTVYKQSFTARADMDINITDVDTRRNITYNSYSESYHWEDAYATYTGDRRALNDDDRILISRSNNNQGPDRQAVLNELYTRLYPHIKNRIAYAVDW